jgi:hypothetical protein
MFNRKKPATSTLFLNAGAHIQHHYFFNAEPIRIFSSSKNPNWYVAENNDPLADVLSLYDLIVGEYFSRGDIDVMLATGLAQKPYDRIKFYYRLNNHADFLMQLGIVFSSVVPLMTRDFLINFENELQAKIAQDELARISVVDENILLFGEIDNRGNSLFVTLTYQLEITSATQYQVRERKLPLHNEVSFVAIKNGMHQGEGFAFFTPGVAAHAPRDGAHVAELGRSVLSYFGVAA